MGSRGPAKKPTKLKLLLGNPGKQKLNMNEPQPPEVIKIPEFPEWFSDRHKKIWNKLCPLLIASKILTEVDLNTLARYVDSLLEWLDAKLFIDKHGISYPIYERRKLRNKTTGKYEEQDVLKYLVQFPQVALKKSAAAELLRLEREFGLTPSSRSNITLGLGDNDNNTEEDPFAI